MTSLVGFLVHLNHGAQYVLVLVVVGVDIVTLDEVVTVQFHLLASDT